MDPAIKTVIIRPKEDPDLMLNAGVNPIAKSERLVIYVPDESFECYVDDHAVFASFSDYLVPLSSYEGTDLATELGGDSGSEVILEGYLFGFNKGFDFYGIIAYGDHTLPTA